MTAAAAEAGPPRSIEDVPDDAHLFAADLAQLFGWQETTVKKYRLSGYLPAPDDWERPPGRPWTGRPGSGPPSPYWLGATIKAFDASTQRVPGKPRKDGQPRVRRKAPDRPGPKPGTGTAAQLVSQALRDLGGGTATDEQVRLHLAGKGHRLTAQRVRETLAGLAGRNTKPVNRPPGPA